VELERNLGNIKNSRSHWRSWPKTHYCQ